MDQDESHENKCCHPFIAWSDLLKLGSKWEMEKVLGRADHMSDFRILNYFMILRDLMATRSNPEATRGSVLLVLRYQGLFKHNLVDEHLPQQQT